MSNQNKSILLKMEVHENSNPAQTLSWMLRNFMCNVCHKNLQGTPRREEAHKMAITMVVNANDTLQITSQEAHDICTELQNIEEQIYPGCSLI